MFDVLKTLNFLTDLEIDTNTCIQTPMRFITVELTLTDTGLENYQKVLALVFEYLRKVREEWLADGQEILFFKEMQTISNLAWNMYVIPEKLEHACGLSQAMIHIKD